MEGLRACQSHETRAGRKAFKRYGVIGSRGGCDQVVIGKYQNALYSVPTVYELDSAPELIGY